MRIDRTGVLRALGIAAALVVVACGSDTPHVEQAGSAPLTESSVTLKQTGNAAIAIVAGSVQYKLDDARLLQVTLTLHSSAAGLQTVTLRGSLYDKAGRLVGDASGGQLGVAPGSTTTVTLSGPTPTGVIAAATYEITTIPAPTPIG